MDLEELRTARDQERRTDSLQHLRDSFYDEATEYVRELKRERSRRADAAGDPYTPEALRLTDEIDAARETVESLYERRRGKLVELASFAAASKSVETEGMTEQERQLFDDLVDRIKQNERRVLDSSLDDSRASGAPDEPATPVVETPDAEAAAADPTDDNTLAAAMGVGDNSPTDDPAVTPADGPAVDSPADGTEAGGGTNPTAEAGGGTNTAGEADTTVRTDPTTDTGVEAATGAGGTPADATSETGPRTDSSTETGTAIDASAGTGTTDASTATDAGTASAATSSVSKSDDTNRPSAEAAVVAGTDDAVVSEPTPAASDSLTSASQAPDNAELSATDADSTPTDAELSATDAGSTPTDETDTDVIERETVRVTREVGELLGVDNVRYELAPGDTVFLPTTNVEPLIENDAAERL